MPSHKNSTRNQKFTTGFTLIELVVALGIVVVIFGLGTFVSMDLYRAHVFTAEKTTLLTLLQKARSQAQHHIGGMAHGVSVTESAYILFSGPSYALRNTSKDIPFPTSPSIQKSGLSEIIFAPLTAQVSSPGSMTLTSDSHSVTLSVNSEGQIDW